MSWEKVISGAEQDLAKQNGSAVMRMPWGTRFWSGSKDLESTIFWNVHPLLRKGEAHPAFPQKNRSVQERVGEKNFRTENQQFTAHTISVSD